MKAYYFKEEQAVKQNYTIFNSIPTSFILEPNVENDELYSFFQRYKELSQGSYFREQMPEKHCEKNYWLIKPANMNQGRGIEISNSLKDIKNIINSKPAHSKWVVQKYIEKPLLYKNRKFDIRVWACVTDRLDLFFYKDGYIRTSSEEFTFDTSLNYVHLTNNCLQVHGENYGKHEDGNTISFDTMQTYWDEQKYKVSFEKYIIPRIKDLIIDTILPLKRRIIVPIKKRFSNFELLGYDFMIDEDFRVWLIEVNTNPYIGIPNKFIAEILPKMLDNLFSLTLDSIYPPKELNKENNFELLYCEKESAFSGTQINLRRSFNKDLIYPIKIAEKGPPKKTFIRDRISINDLRPTEFIKFTPKHLKPENDALDKSSPNLLEKSHLERYHYHKNIKTAKLLVVNPPTGTLEEQSKEIIKNQQWMQLKNLFSKMVSGIVNNTIQENEIIPVFLSIIKLNKKDDKIYRKDWKFK